MPGIDVNPMGNTDWPGFWSGKIPCWVLLGCSTYAHRDCPAYQHPETPCWEQAFTQCEKILGLTHDCHGCKVFRCYGSSRGRLS